MVAGRTYSRGGGFTLVELAISILVISLLIGSIVAVETQNVRVEQREELSRKLDIIAAALYNYRLANNKLPCPDDSSKARTHAKFALQADGAAGACNAGATVSSNLSTSDAGTSVFGGGVPVRTLGLPDDVAFDPWGNQFTYYIDKNANVSTNFTGTRGTYGFTDTDKLNVSDESGATLSDSVLAVVFSHGQNGHGAFNNAGNRLSSGSTHTSELQNCMCDATATAASYSTLVIRMQRELPTSALAFTTNFDDVGRFFNKQYFYTYSEKRP